MNKLIQCDNCHSKFDFNTNYSIKTQAGFKVFCSSKCFLAFDQENYSYVRSDNLTFRKSIPIAYRGRPSSPVHITPELIKWAGE